jgi:hypothetical protein
MTPDTTYAVMLVLIALTVACLQADDDDDDYGDYA